MGKKYYSKDPKTRVISIKTFYENCDYLCTIRKRDLFTKNKKPECNHTYYKFTPNYLICLIYSYAFNIKTMIVKEKLDTIKVSIRDGKTEYDILENKINEVKEQIKQRKTKKREERLQALENAKKLLPQYKEIIEPEAKSFESYLFDTGYKTANEKLKNKYLVFDVETNGLRMSNDDLLSLSIYDPTTGMCYNRYLPLDMQPLVLTGYINGITEKELSKQTHITQEEMDWLYDYFHFKDKILLSFSGGKGAFDYTFVQNYLKRHKIIGFDDLVFENIKNMIPQAPYAKEGQLSKDNLCSVFGIEGVQSTHSSSNDCILEWKLFEKLKTEFLFFIKNYLYIYTPEYIIPYTYLYSHPELIKYSNIQLPKVEGKAIELLRIAFPKKLLNKIKKFPTNITGITIEHGINSYLNAEKQDNYAFLTANKSHLKYIGSLESKVNEIPIIEEDDGTIKGIREEDQQFIDEINSTTKLIIDHIKPISDYLKENIFKDGKIMTQELVISDDKKVLTLCDLSDKNNVVEIKTIQITDDENNVKPGIARQLFYQSNGRNIYVISLVFETHWNKQFKQIIDNLSVILYNVELIKS